MPTIPRPGHTLRPLLLGPVVRFLIEVKPERRAVRGPDAEAPGYEQHAYRPKGQNLYVTLCDQPVDVRHPHVLDRGEVTCLRCKGTLLWLSQYATSWREA